MKSDTFSGTTNSNGLLTVDSTGKRVVVAVQVDSFSGGFAFATGANFNSGSFRESDIYVGLATGASASNTVSGTYWYVEK